MHFFLLTPDFLTVMHIKYLQKTEKHLNINLKLFRVRKWDPFMVYNSDGELASVSCSRSEVHEEISPRFVGSEL